MPTATQIYNTCGWAVYNAVRGVATGQPFVMSSSAALQALGVPAAQADALFAAFPGQTITALDDSGLSIMYKAIAADWAAASTLAQLQAKYGLPNWQLRQILWLPVEGPLPAGRT